MSITTGHPGKWLILAYFFNTDGKAASQTITDRIPLLLEEDILPVVISAPLGDKDRRFPHIRVFSLMPSGFQYELRYLLKKKEKSGGGWRILKNISSILLLPLYLLERLVCHLETHWSWGLSATLRGMAAIFRYRPEVIYTTAGPSTTHLAGYLLHSLSGLPWIAEIHDPLVYDMDKGRLNQRFLFNNWLEAKICNRASAVIYFTHHALASADRRHPVAGLKAVLRPGAAPPAATGAAYAKKETIHFGHFGSLASGRNLAMLIRALYSLFQEEPDLQQLVCLDVYGSGLDPVSKKTLAAFPLGSSLQEHGRLEYDEKTGKSGRQQALEAMRQCDVLVILHGSGTVCEEYVPSKVYEYLLTGRPILGCTPRTSELGAILIETGHQVVDPDDQEAIKNALQEYITAWSGKGLAGTDTVSPYTIDRTVRGLISIADQITAGRGRQS